MGLKENLEKIQSLSHQAELGGGEERLKRQREGGRLTARESPLSADREMEVRRILRFRR